MKPHPARSKTLATLAFGAILAFFIYSLTDDIDRPWVNQIDFNGAVWSQAAHNILRAGLIETQGASTAFYFGPLPIPDAGYYLHHPPLLHLSVAAIFSVLGEHEWAARAVPIVCSLASLALLWLLICNTLGHRTAVFCTAILVALPMMLRYGAMVNFEPVVLTFILLSLLALRYWETSGSLLWKWTFFASLLVGMWVDWAMHLFALVLFAWWMTRPGRPARRLAWAVMGITVFSGLAYLIHTQFLRSDALKDLHNTFLVRVASDENYKFTFAQWCHKVTGSIVRHYLWSNLLLAAVGIIITWRRRRDNEGLRWIGWACFMVFAMDAIFVGVFQNDSYIHEYIAFYFVIPVAVMAGIALEEAARFLETAARGRLHVVGNAALALLIILSISWGEIKTEAMEGRFCILDLAKKESPKLIPSLGAAIRKHFSPHTQVLCNFMPYYGPQLQYYAKREIASNLSDPQDWKPFLQKVKGPVGGIVWMGDEDASAILANLPPGKKEFVQLENENFCVWTPKQDRF